MTNTTPNPQSGPGHNHLPAQTGVLTFGRDHHLRRRLFTESSFQHKARVNLYWLAWLLHQHTSPTTTVLDPMGGVGSILLAATEQRPVITGDIEPHWATIQAEIARRIRHEMLFSAPAITCQWDAAKLPLPSGSVPAIVTSPPYFDLFSNWNRKSGTDFDGNPDHIGETGLCYGFHPAQVGNIHIYENYLRAMRKIYTECWRVLVPGGKLILIVGDKVRKRQIVPVTKDTQTLCQANGFRLITQHQRHVTPSHFRLIHKIRNGIDYPLIDLETALIFQKQDYRLPIKFAIVEAPNTYSRPACKSAGRPGQQLFDKQLAYADQVTDLTFILTKTGLVSGHTPNSIWSGDHPRKARTRRRWAYSIVEDLVTKHGLTAGAHIDLHVTDRYARYLDQRLTTLGCGCSIPTQHRNLGQKLAWYTNAINTPLEQDQTTICSDCGATIPNDGCCWYCENHPNTKLPDVAQNPASPQYHKGGQLV
jgi:SAM-dependent methyltransferase